MSEKASKKNYLVTFIFIFEVYLFTVVNKQLADKERIAAAIENEHLLKVLHKCLDMRKSVHCK